MKIYFIREAGSSRDSFVSQEAFKIFVKNKLSPVHIDEDEIASIPNKDESVFVVEDITSSVAIKLDKKKLQIITPHVVLYLRHKSGIYNSIPKRTHLLMSQCLRSIKITSTGFSDEKEKEDMIKKIRQMAGLYSPDLDSSINVLIAKNILSEKYRVACSLGINVVTKEWVKQCWDKHQYDIKAGLDVISQYTAPVFYNLQFCASGITLEERVEIEKIVTANGAKYSGVMNRDTDILVSNGVVSPKTDLAQSMNIAVVTSKWLHESLDAKYSLPFDDYKINATIRDDRYDAMLQEEMSSKMATSSTFKTSVRDNIKEANNSNGSKVTLYAPITNFDASDKASIEKIQQLCSKISGESFLDDLTIFVLGFGSHILRAVKRACTCAGAVFINSQLDSTPTHIIIGPQVGDMVLDEHVIDTLKKLKDSTVSIDWLIDCMTDCTYHEPKSYLHNPFEATTKRPARLITSPRTEYSEEEIKVPQPPKAKVAKKELFPPLAEITSNVTESTSSSDADNSKTVKYLILSGFPNPKDLITSRIRSNFEVLTAVPKDPKVASQCCLVVKEMASTEKVLASIAAGLFIVKPSFLKAKEFTHDIALQHEWCTDLKTYEKVLDKKITPAVQSLMFSSRLCRKHLQKTGERLFEDVSVLLMNESDEMESVAVILRAGGAIVYTHTVDDLRRCSKKHVDFALVDLDNLAGTRTREMNDLLDECADTYGMHRKLFQCKFLANFIASLESTSFGFFKKMCQSSFVFPAALKQFCATYEQFEDAL